MSSDAFTATTLAVDASHFQIELHEGLLAIALLVGGSLLLRSHAWRAVLCLRPQSMQVEVETPAHATQVSDSLADTWAELTKLGFTLLGTHSEKSPWAPAIHFLDGAHPTLPVVASLSVDSQGEDRLLLLTQSERGFVLTANYQRPSVEVPGRYLAGGLEGVSPERLLKAHLRRVPEIGTPLNLSTLESRVKAAQVWYSTSGKAELRQQHAVGLLWTAGALGIVGTGIAIFVEAM